MELNVTERESRKGIKALRREGFIPAVVYDKSGNSTPVKLERKEFEAHLRQIEEGGLATVRFKLTLGKETFTAFVKDVAYHRVSYDIQHIDFLKVTDDERISVHVPVILKNADRCVGVTQGGQLKKVKRSVLVSAIVKEIPKHFVLDVADKNLGDQGRVSDLELTPSMRLKIHPKQVLVSVRKR